MPVATAGWGDLVGIILFLVISGWINYSRRKKAEQEAQGIPGPQPAGRAPGGGTAAPARRHAPAPDDAEEEEAEGWDAESWDGERSERWDDHDVRETRSHEARDPEARSGEARAAEHRLETLAGGRRPGSSGSAEPARHVEAQRRNPDDREEAARKRQAPPVVDKAREKASEMGRDLLTQLAKELGLELPKPDTKPAPKPPAPATQAPQPPQGRTPSRPPAPASRHASAGPDAARARAAEEARARSLYATHAGRAAAAPIPAPGASEARPAEGVVAADLAHPEAMRRAFILKTILDRPVSMRMPGGPGASVS